MLKNLAIFIVFFCSPSLADTYVEWGGLSYYATFDSGGKIISARNLRIVHPALIGDQTPCAKSSASTPNCRIDKFYGPDCGSSTGKLCYVGKTNEKLGAGVSKFNSLNLDYRSQFSPYPCVMVAWTVKAPGVDIYKVLGGDLNGNTVCGGNSGGGGPNPPKPPTPVTSCAVNNVTIDHGTLNQSDISGSKATGSLRVECNQDANVKVRVTSSDNNSSMIHLDKSVGLTSMLTINGVSGHQGVVVSIKKGVPSNQYIQSTLGGLNIPASNYSGSGVARVDIL